MARPRKLTAEKIISALQKADGILIDAARLLGVTRQTLYNYMKGNDVIAEAYDQINESTIDKVEGKLLKAAYQGNVTAQIFYLKTKGKVRGYVERQEIAGADDKPIKVIVEYANDTNGNPAETA